MPIRPHLRGFYPIDWKQLSAVIRFERAKGRCEACGRPHGRLVRCLADGTWYDEERGAWRCGRGRVARRKVSSEAMIRLTKVALATAHLDHDPTNNAAANLKALCQRCHILHDQHEHRHQRWLTLRARKAMRDLFEGIRP